MNDQLNRELSLIKIGSWPGGHDDFIHFFKFTIAIRDLNHLLQVFLS